MARRKRGARILGPYYQPGRDEWVTAEPQPDGTRKSCRFKTELEAREYVDEFNKALDSTEHSTTSALEEYANHLTAEGNAAESIYCTKVAICSFFPQPIPLHLLSEKRVKKLYEDLRTRPSERTGAPLAADTHRNRLAETKTFLRWCVAQGYLPRDPSEKVAGTGKRRPRGKSLGKSGQELHTREARRFFQTALALGAQGDERAIGALVALLLGMRAKEIVNRKVRDLDEDELPGDLLWIPCSKTPAGRRTLEVPEELRVLLVPLTEGKSGDRWLFESKPKKKGAPPQRHWRDWVRKSVWYVCDAARVPRVTAHAMRGLLASLTNERGELGHAIAAMLGHADDGETAQHSYARPGASAAGTRKRGLVVLKGGRAKPK